MKNISYMNTKCKENIKRLNYNQSNYRHLHIAGTIEFIEISFGKLIHNN